jgi:putative membrane protein
LEKDLFHAAKARETRESRQPSTRQKRAATEPGSENAAPVAPDESLSGALPGRSLWPAMRLPHALRAVVVIEVAVLVGAGQLAGCGGRRQDGTPDTTRLEASDAVGGNRAGWTDARIAAAVAAIHQVEISNGGFAQVRATDTRVTALAQRMVVDHSTMDHELAALARWVAADAEPDSGAKQLLERGRRVRDSLQALPAERFDVAYAAHEVAFHQDAVRALDGVFLPSVRGSELRAMLQTLRPALLSHLEHARRVLGLLGGEPA